MGPGVSEAGDELKRFSPGERKSHSHLLPAWLLLQAVRQGLQFLAPLGAGDAVPAAAGNDPASPAGLPGPGQCVEKLRKEVNHTEARAFQQWVYTLGGTVLWMRGPDCGVPALGNTTTFAASTVSPTGGPSLLIGDNSKHVVRD